MLSFIELFSGSAVLQKLSGFNSKFGLHGPVINFIHNNADKILYLIGFDKAENFSKLPHDQHAVAGLQSVDACPETREPAFPSNP